MSETPQGYQGPLPANYVQSSAPQTPNLGLTLTGQDPIIAYNFVLIDTAVGSGGGGGSPGGNVGDVQFKSGMTTFGGTDNFFWDTAGDFGLAITAAQTAAFFTTDNLGVTVSGPLGIGIEVDLSGTVTGTAIGIDDLIRSSGTSGVVKGQRILIVNSGSITQGIGLDLQGLTGTASNFVNLRINGSANGADPDSRALQVLDGILEFASGTTLLAGNTFVDPTDQTRGFELNFGNIVTGNIWDVHIPDADSSTAQAATVVSGKALASFDITSGNWTYVDVTANTGTVTSVTFTGDGTVLSSTPSSAVTTTGTLTATLASAAGGTVLGRVATTAGAPAYTIAPHLGIPGTSTGSIALASSTASGLFTLTAPASAATPTLTLPTTANVLAGQFAGDGTVLSSTLAVASAAGTVTAALANAAGGTLLGNATTGSTTPTYTTAPVLGIPGTSTGTIALASATASGKYTITAPANAATPTLTLPTGTGTFAVTATTPIVLNATTGALTAPTAVTSAASLASGNFLSGAGSQAIQDTGVPFYLDPTAYSWFFDDFITGSSSNTTTASLMNTGGAGINWGCQVASNANSIGITADLSGGANGIALLTTSTTSGHFAYLLGAAESGVVLTGQNLAAVTFDFRFRIKISSTTNIAAFVGFTDNAGTNQMAIGYDTSASDTIWTAHFIKASSTTNSAITGSTVNNTGYHTLRMRSTTPGTVLCSADGGAEISVATNVPVVAMSPYIQVITKTTASVNMKCDYAWGWQAISRTA